METVRFLRDLDDEKAFAQGLELAYLDAFNAVTDIANRMYRNRVLFEAPDSCRHEDTHKEVRHALYIMSLVIRDCIDRRRRLADVARGLSDVVFDEETPKS